MKKFITILLVLAMTMSLCACGGVESVLEAENVKIDGICVDDSYRDEDGSSIRLVYLFCTLTPQDKNLSVSGVGTKMIFGEDNDYSSKHIPDVCDYATSYAYSSYVKHVNMGESVKLATTFEIPEAQLKAEGKITLADDDIPGIEEISFTAEDIQHFDGAEAIAEAVDPEGYNAEKTARTIADADTTARVKSKIDGYYWEFYVNMTWYELEFFANNTYELRTRFGTTTGTYSVTNGYVECTNDATKAVVYIPYTFEGDQIKLDAATAFSVFEG